MDIFELTKAFYPYAAGMRVARLELSQATGQLPVLYNHPFARYVCRITLVESETQNTQVVATYTELEGLMELLGVDMPSWLNGFHFPTFSHNRVQDDFSRLLSETQGGLHSEYARDLVKGAITHLVCYNDPCWKVGHPYIGYRIFTRIFESPELLRKLCDDIYRYSNGAMTAEYGERHDSPTGPFRTLNVVTESERKTYWLTPTAMPFQLPS